MYGMMQSSLSFFRLQASPAPTLWYFQSSSYIQAVNRYHQVILVDVCIIAELAQVGDNFDFGASSDSGPVRE